MPPPRAWDADVREFIETTSFDLSPSAEDVDAFIDADTDTADE